MSKYNPTGAEPVPDALLMYAADQNGTYLPSNENVQFNGNLSIPFEAGKTYRLRVLNTGVFAMTFFWIDGHEMQVIEADGVRLSLFTRLCATLRAAHPMPSEPDTEFASCRSTPSRTRSTFSQSRSPSVTRSSSRLATTRRRTGSSTPTLTTRCSTLSPRASRSVRRVAPLPLGLRQGGSSQLS
mgnify:CR=1 FL=1